MEAPASTCPKCGAVRHPEALECPACGIIYARYRAPEQPPPAFPPPDEPSSPYAPPTTWRSAEAPPVSGLPGDIPEPPGQTWVVVLLLSVVTCGIFAIIQAFRQAAYARKLDESNAALPLYIANVVLSILSGFLKPEIVGGDMPMLSLGASLAASICFLIGAFQIRSTFERRLNLSLSGVMTFFFNTFYFQYHLHNVHEERRVRALSLL